MFITFETENASYIYKAKDIKSVVFYDNYSDFTISFEDGNYKSYEFGDYIAARAQFNSIMKQLKGEC